MSTARHEDQIHIKDLLVRGIVGVNDEERRKRQDILVNLTLLTDTRKAAETDDLDDSCNYRTVSKAVIALVEGSEFFTVEKLAAVIARDVLENEGITEVTVTVEKPGALRFARSVGVTITRRPEDFIS
jgi:FolB domain-containing protein